MQKNAEYVNISSDSSMFETKDTTINFGDAIIPKIEKIWVKVLGFPLFPNLGMHKLNDLFVC